MKAILVGAYEKKDGENKTLVLTTLAEKINKETGGKLLEQLNVLGPLKQNKTRFFYHLHKDYPVVAVVGLGSQDATLNEMEDIHEGRENVRSAIGHGVIALRELNDKIQLVEVDGCNDPQSAAEGATLANYSFDEYKEEPLRVKFHPVKLAQTDAASVEQYQRGIILAESQNRCRNMMEQPANMLTPTRFGEIAKEIAEPLGVTVHVRDREWIEKMKMGSFLSVSRGSDQPPKFVELHLQNAGDQRKPLVFVGKGITFDSGGISLKPGANMDEMRADCGGACNVLNTIVALAKLKAKVNVIGLIPLTENLPSGKATKPGDVVFAMNGKSIQINNTDAEGRLILADALCYADTFKPELVIDIATLTGAAIIALGGAASAVFSTNNDYWNLIRSSSHETGDRVWRMPLYKAYTKKTTDSILADLVNISKDSSWGAGTAIAAAFLREFVGPNSPNWMHIDIASTMVNKGDYSYMSKGMSGRCLRTMVHFIERVFEKN